MRYALWGATGWHRDYSPPAWKNRVTVEQKREGWEMAVRIRLSPRCLARPTSGRSRRSWTLLKRDRRVYIEAHLDLVYDESTPGTPGNGLTQGQTTRIYPRYPRYSYSQVGLPGVPRVKCTIGHPRDIASPGDCTRMVIRDGERSSEYFKRFRHDVTNRFEERLIFSENTKHGVCHVPTLLCLRTTL